MEEWVPAGEEDDKNMFRVDGCSLVSVITVAHGSCDCAYSNSDIQHTYKISDEPGFACVIMYARKGNHLYIDSGRNSYIVIS